MEHVLIELVRGPIDAARVRGFVVGDPVLGGLAFFEGATRAESDPAHGVLLYLDYEAYDAMAVRQMHVLADEVGRRWYAGRVAILHRLGRVRPGEASVMIAVACAHRGEAFDACRWIIDTLKQDVPIWKKDVFEDGFERWVEPGVGRLGGNDAGAPAGPRSTGA